MSAARVCAQSSESPVGFISIDCGLSEEASYTDPATGSIEYVSDAGFIDSGVNSNISTNPTSIPKQFFNVRAFPDGTRNCYTFNSIAPNTKYLLRAMFLYGNYDGRNSTQILFDLYLGVNLWKAINLTDPGNAYRTEVITAANSAVDSIQVCLVNTGQGTPFISGLDLRPLGDILYPEVNATRSLVLESRFNVGPSDTDIRYPDDPRDRIWEPFNNAGRWQEISTNSAVVSDWDINYFEPPSRVMQTAAVPADNATGRLLLFSWEHQPDDINQYFLIAYFSEIQQLSGNMTRSFYLKLNGDLWNLNPFTPRHLLSDIFYSLNPEPTFSQFNFTIEATGNSTLPPLLNAIEVYTAMRNDSVPADLRDVSGMMMIKESYQIDRIWMGDPCSPKDYSWEGLACTYTLYDSPRITSINLSTSGLNGEITNSFGNPDAIQSLDLSYNNLTGTIPDIIGQLPFLTLLDLTGNRLDGSIPSALLAKSQNGSLTLRIKGNELCNTNSSCGATPSSSKKKIATSVIVIISVASVVALLVAGSIVYKLRNPKGSKTDTSSKTEKAYLHVREYQDNSLQLENRQFTYLELKKITNDFEKQLGKGGFGTVYYGSLEDGTQVAVKMLSQSSTQGTKEFRAEVQHLARVHHRYLVSMVGYCKDEEYLALVYEYMSKGNLATELRGRTQSSNTLSWRQRLQIALEAAQGLEYLHKGCKPPLIHRDVKTANILLSESFEAKIADFGLSKAFENDNRMISTALVGTPGYLDPEYYTTYSFSEKNDVYSFGVVLLELITGQSPILPKDHIFCELAENGHIVQWVLHSLAKGNIEDVIDARMIGDYYDLNSVWKCTEVALRCTSDSSKQRPGMADVVMLLKESLELQRAMDANEILLYKESSNSTDVVSQNTLIEMKNMAEISLVAGPTAR